MSKNSLNNKKNFSNLFVFGASKGSVFFAPLFAASVLSSTNYGLIEWALSLSMILGIVFSFGAGGVLAFEIVKNDKSDLISIALSYMVFVTFLFGVLGITSLVLHFSHKTSFIIGFTGLFAGQFALSSYMKAKGMGAFASTVESFIYVAILILVFNSFIKKIIYLEYIGIFPVFVLLFSSIIFFALLNRKLVFNLGHYIRFGKRGLPILFSSLLSIGLINLPRVLLGGVGSFDEVAEFSLYFRWTGIALVLYQFVYVVKFREIYTYSYGKFDNYITIISWLVLLSGIFITLGLVLLKKYNLTFGVNLPERNFVIQGYMVGVVTLWTITASLEGVFFREHLTRWQIYANVLGISVFLSLLLLLRIPFSNNLLVFTMAWFFAFIVIVLTQIFFLKKNIAQASLKYLTISMSLITFMGGMLVVIGVLL